MKRVSKFIISLASATCILILSCSKGVETPPPGPQDEPKGDNQISGFSLRLTQNGTPKEYAGTIDNTKGTITVVVPGVEWIDNIGSATAEFTSDGETVKVADVEQVSGTTPNDFTTDVIYTVTAGNGEERRYTVDVVSPQSSGLPVVRIDTKGGAPILDKENYVTSTFSIMDGGNPGNNISEVAAGVRGRGNSTWEFAKKPYRVKLDKKASVFGLEAAKNWVLLACWQDPTYIMNTVAFELSRRLGLAFSPTATHVELFLNGAYKGSYMMCEHIQVNKGRVDIDEFRDVFLEMDAYYDEAYKFKSAQLQLPVMFKSPEFEDVTDTERETFIAAVKTDFNKMEAAVMSLNGWRNHIDVASLINYLIVNELTRNTELQHPKSTYLFRKGNGKWTWGPVWDCDWAYGFAENTTQQNYWMPGTESSFLYTPQNKDQRCGTRFFTKLFEDISFKAQYKARWKAVKAQMEDMDVFIAEMGASLAESDIHNKKVWGSHYVKNYNEQIVAMRSWLNRRISALDAMVAGY